MNGRGETHAAMGSGDEALADLTQVIDLDPNLTWVNGSRSQADEANGRGEEALADYTRGVDSDLTRTTLGLCAAAAEPTGMAAIRRPGRLHLGDRLGLEPRLGDLSGAQAYQAMDRGEEALAHYTRAIDPSLSLARAIAGGGETHAADGPP